MTMDDYVLFAGADRDLIEEVAALAGKTGKELVEYISGSSIKTLKEVIGRNLGAPRNTAIAQVSGNVIQVNFNAKNAAPWKDRKSCSEPSKRLQFSNRVSIMLARVPCTSPNANSSAVPSTSPNTGFPYSSR